MDIKTSFDLMNAEKQALAGVVEGRAMRNASLKGKFPKVSRADQMDDTKYFICETCAGAGLLKVETGRLKNAVGAVLIDKLPDQLLPCPVCAGVGVILSLSTNQLKTAHYETVAA